MYLAAQYLFETSNTSHWPRISKLTKLSGIYCENSGRIFWYNCIYRPSKFWNEEFIYCGFILIGTYTLLRNQCEWTHNNNNYFKLVSFIRYSNDPKLPQLTDQANLLDKQTDEISKVTMIHKEPPFIDYPGIRLVKV